MPRASSGTDGDGGSDGGGGGGLNSPLVYDGVYWWHYPSGPNTPGL